MAGNGVRSVIEAWNSMAYSPDDRAAYFCANGGHHDWGGNECYAFYLDQAKWERLTQPSAYPPGTTLASTPYPLPISGPPSTHTYDGVWYYPPTKTVMLIPGSAFAGGESVFGKQLWEFNPSKVETRNGLPPLAWRKVTDDTKMATVFARSAVLPDGTVYVGSAGRSWVYDPRANAATSFATAGDWGDGNSIYDKTRNVVWHSMAKHLLSSQVPITTSVQDVAPMPAFAGTGLALDDKGRLFVWDGGPNVLRYEPETNKWFGYLYPSGPDGLRPYGKFVFVEPEKVFIGISGAFSSMWVYQPPSGSGLPMTTKTAQSFVDQATGASVVIPPGIYSGGLRLNRPLTVNLQGVVLTGVVDSKGFVLVENTPGPVVIENFETLLAPHLGTNAAGVRIQGGGDVTIRRAHIANSEMGIVSGNEGTGKLTIEDSLIERQGGGSDLSHGIYAGVSDTLTILRTTVRDVKGLGHLVKSRAKTTTIDRSYLLGLNGIDSREFEAPNGGHVSITRSVIQKGPNTDNAEFTMVGGEILQSAPVELPYLPSSFTFTDNWLIFDRMATPPERAWQAGPNQFGKYRNMPPTWLNVPAPPAPVIQRNKFVNMTNPGEFPPFDSSNTFFPTRAAAGLGPTSIPATP
jgi:hypothetical protein